MLEWKTLGIKARLISTKQNLLRLLKSIGAPPKEDQDASLPAAVFVLPRYKLASALTAYSFEAQLKKAELRKAEALAYSARQQGDLARLR